MVARRLRGDTAGDDLDSFPVFPMKHRPLLGSIVLALAASTAAAHIGSYDSALHAHSIPFARRLARPEGKLLLVHVSEDPARGLPYFRWPTPDARRTLDLFVRETVITELDVETDAEQVAELGVSAPALLIMDPSGNVLWRFEGELGLRSLLRRTRGWFEGEAALARVEVALENKGREHDFTRERLAAVHARNGELELALGEYVWCVERAVTGRSPAAVARRARLFEEVGELAERIPRAEALVDELLLQIERRLHAEEDGLLARDYARWNHARGLGERTLATYRALEVGNRARRGLFDAVFDELVRAGDYEEALSAIRPLEAFLGEVAHVERTAVTRPAFAARGTGRGTRSFALRRGGGLVEALAATRRDEEARALLEAILRFDGTPGTRALLREYLGRSGSATLLPLVADRREKEVRVR